MSLVTSLRQPTSFDLRELATKLRTSPPYEKEGHTAQTLLRETDSRVVMVVIRAGNLIPEHAARETALVQVLSGRIELRIGGNSIELSAGSLLAIPADMRHDVRASLDSAFLLTLGALVQSA